MSGLGAVVVAVADATSHDPSEALVIHRSHPIRMNYSYLDDCSLVLLPVAQVTLSLAATLVQGTNL